MILSKNSVPFRETELPSMNKNFQLDQWQAGKISSFSQTCFAEYWDDLPPIVDDSKQQQQQQQQQQPAENKEGLRTVDPYDFFHRMALAKVLVQDTGGDKIWGNNKGSKSIASCSQHPIWGYATQMDWQHRSGRFQDPSEWQDETNGTLLLQDIGNRNQQQPGSSKISRKSWWGYMNLHFSVAIYCGAARAGLVPDISLSDPSVWSDAGFLKCVDIWKGFWEFYKSNFLPAMMDNDNDDDEAEECIKDAMYRKLWQTHTGIIQTGLFHGKELEAMLPPEDRNAGLGWCNMVELLAATNWPLLSLDNLCKFGCGYLPCVRLGGPRTVEWLRKHRPLEYTTVQSLYQLVDAPPKMISAVCLVFGRVSKWRFAVRNLPRTLHVLTHGNPIQKILALSRVLLLAVFPRSLYETGIAAALGGTIAVALKGTGKIAKAKRAFGV